MEQGVELALLPFHLSLQPRHFVPKSLDLAVSRLGLFS